jgi:hypothetical protein
VSLVELGVQPGDGPATTVCERVLDYWASQRRLTSVPVVEGRARRCASQEGNAVAVATRTGAPIHPSFAEPHYPPYWHFDVLQALLVLHRAGYGGDRRTDRARACVVGKRRPDGTWHAARRWWRPPGSTAVAEVVDWGEVAHQMVTLNALRVRAG